MGDDNMEAYVLTIVDNAIPMVEQRHVLAAQTQGKMTFAVACPWHTEATPSCVISMTRNIFYCFGCNRTGLCVEASQRAFERWFEVDDYDDDI